MKRLLTIAVVTLASALLVGGQIAAVAHSLAEQHEICEEHGEVIHVPEAAIVAASGQSLDALPPVEHGHGCAVLSGLAAADARPSPTDLPLLFELPDGQPPIVVPAPRPAPAPTLGVAPKTSPPAIATTC